MRWERDHRKGIVYAVYTSAGYAIADAAALHGLYVYTAAAARSPS
jgi:hypothetical protein